MAFGADISETLGNVGNRATPQGYGKADEIRKQYTGYEYDDESGLDFAQARYYNATHGRFTSVDPLTASASIKDPQTFNRYTYAMNSPYKFTDPLGLISSSTGACGQWCQGSGDYIDGSAFRGTDTSMGYNLRTQSQEPPPPPPPSNANADQNNTEEISDAKVDNISVGDVTLTLGKKELKELEKLKRKAKENGEKEKSLFNTARQELIDNVYSALLASGDSTIVGMTREFLLFTITMKMDQIIQVGRFIPEMFQGETSIEFVAGVKVTVQVTDRVKDYNKALAETNTEIDKNRAKFSKWATNISVKHTLSPQVMAMQNNKFKSGKISRRLDENIWEMIFDRRVLPARTGAY